ncbi:hypothetical protein CAPTEDRAFT_200623 [Capitella teleta]|uniref:DNA 3'-5' helicase n=1 Tax=Capitella teleta TaxID=283909 RepID=R7VF72_CAPTE|nr:hypothetical protein CAPTEDRAFT_200623 [Capitella teleta]|eukprot:ELU17259.1 hypothetical protein CAPTEDRAFT_200623 [Capitella teleta]
MDSLLISINADYPLLCVNYLREEQKQALQVLLDGKDCVAVLPTGFGKSLIYGLYPMMLSKIQYETITIVLVVSPLRSLMKDQKTFWSRIGVRCALILPKEEMTDEDWNDIHSGDVQLLMSSPESLLDDSLPWLDLIKSYKTRMCLLVYDEAHVIRAWGDDFRECYSEVGVLRSFVPSTTRTLVMTATLPRTYVNIVLERLHLDRRRVKFVTKSPDR